METQRSHSSTNINDREPQLYDTSLHVPIQLRIGKNTRCRKKIGKRKIHDDVVYSDFHDEVLETFEDDDIFSSQAKIFNIMTKWKANASYH